LLHHGLGRADELVQHGLMQDRRDMHGVRAVKDRLPIEAGVDVLQDPVLCPARSLELRADVLLDLKQAGCHEGCPEQEGVRSLLRR